jgi:hypothetical protein
MKTIFVIILSLGACFVIGQNVVAAFTAMGQATANIVR